MSVGGGPEHGNGRKLDCIVSNCVGEANLTPKAPEPDPQPLLIS